MGGFLSTTYNCPVTDYYGSDWMKGDLSITVDGSGNGSFSLKMTNNWGGTGKCSGSLVLYINGTKMHDLYYNASYTPSASSGTNPSWTTGFPIQNNSSMSGTFSVGSAASFTVHYAVCRSQSAVTYSNSNRLTDGTASVYGTYAFTFTRTTWTDAAKGSLTLTDHGDNSFTIQAGAGTAGTNNAILGLYNLDYRYNSADSWTNWYYETNSNGNDTASNKAVSKRIYFTPTNANANRTVYYRAYWDAVQVAGEDNPHTSTSSTVKQYRDPGAPGKPTLDSSSYRNGRLTIKQNWKYVWSEASNGTDSCPVLGYRIRIYRNGSPITGFSAGSNSVLVKNSGTNEYVDRSGKADCAIILDPVSFGFVPGDTIQIGIYSYAQNGAGTWLYNGGGVGAAQVLSDSSTVQNSGVMRVRPSGSWKEGVVSIKVNNTWKEAEVVYTKVSGAWKEST